TARSRRPTCSASSVARGSIWRRCGIRPARVSRARSPLACTATATAPAGGSCVDVAVTATSTDQATLAVYAAQRSGDGALTVMVVNKAETGQTSTLSLAGITPAASALAYRYSAANLSAIVRLADQPIGAGAFSTTFPATSITLYVIASSGAVA